MHVTFSVFRPKTSFAMRGRLASTEPSLLDRWHRLDVYGQWRDLRAGRPLFVLHDGPPFANGNIHIGHAFQKVLKDMTNRWHFMRNDDVSFVPGWDCHGLPIEAQLEKQWRKDKKAHHSTDVAGFRGACRDYARQWVERQKADFKRLGINGDWDNSYETMDYRFEARIAHHLFSLVDKGFVYRGLRPVLWSPSEQTALAEAEVEYQDIESPSLYLRFPVVKGVGAAEQASVVIWTTTPWSLPGNRAVAYQPDAQYAMIKVDAVHDGAHVSCADVLLVAMDLVDTVCTQANIAQYTIMQTMDGHAFDQTILNHPFHRWGYDAVPMIPSEFATTDMGTGFVHTAPCHGVDDFTLGQRHGLDVGHPLSDRGIFNDHVPLLAGLAMDKAYPTIQKALMDSKTLVAEHAYTHSYPHSWRSKKPLFYRATPQWFIALDGPGQLRQKALDTLSTVRWHPESGETRMRAMLESRPDWCISRQRLWGVPIPLFVHKQTGQILHDRAVFDRIVQRATTEGFDFWFTDQGYDVLGNAYDAQEWEKCHDIIDVWFESGVTNQVVLKDGVLPTTGSIEWPASLYLEGSDQTRGWFQSSLVTAVALDGCAPYRSVLTHGYCLDAQGRKMSKSLGNVVGPQEVVQSMGADILRLWAGYEDSKKDVRVGKDILDRVQDMYRRIRNTLRYCLGGLDGLQHDELCSVQDMDVLERWVHCRLYCIDKDIRAALETYDYRTIVHTLHLFCNQDLSAFYFDACKDVLYCDDASSTRRRQVRTTLMHIFVCLTHWLAPFLVMTAEEAWIHFGQDVVGLDPDTMTPQDSTGWILRYLADQGLWDAASATGGAFSIHLSQMPTIPDQWHHEASLDGVTALRHVKSVVTGDIEKKRDTLRSNLHAIATVHWEKDPLYAWSDDVVARVCGVSSVVQVTGAGMPDAGHNTEIPGVHVSIDTAQGTKCQRCWRIMTDVVDDLCGRCTAVVAGAPVS